MTRVIEKGIPIPERAYSTSLAKQMQIGDSILFNTERQAKWLCENLRRMRRKPCQRKTSDGWRVWRVK